MMNEEKTMILNMLKDGKISVEEAQALLEAVEEKTGEEETQHTEEDRLKIDLDEMKESLKDGFRGFGKTMEGTIRSVVEGFKSMDFGETVSNAFGSAKATAEKELILSAENLSGLNLKTQSGDVTVSGSDSADVLIQAVVTARGSDQENAKKRAEELEIIHEVEDGTLFIKDSGTRMQITGPYSVDYRVTVPRDFNMKLTTMSGDVAVRKIGAAVGITNYSGDITCRDCSESVKINTKSGDVFIEGFTGDIGLRTLSGDISLSDIVSGTLSCNTLSGDIEGALNPAAGSSVTAKSLSGDIKLKIDTSAELGITAETLSGDITCGLPVLSAEKKNRRFTAVLNADNGSLNVTTKSGDISLSPLEKVED